MGYNDNRNPLSYILPAGVLAYVASPQVRKVVREAVVKGVATAMDMADRAEQATGGLREEFERIKEDAEKLRRQEKEPAVHIQVEDQEAPGEAGAGPEAAAA